MMNLILGSWIPGQLKIFLNLLMITGNRPVPAMLYFGEMPALILKRISVPMSKKILYLPMDVQSVITGLSVLMAMMTSYQKCLSVEFQYNLNEKQKSLLIRSSLTKIPLRMDGRKIFCSSQGASIGLSKLYLWINRIILSINIFCHRQPVAGL